MPVEGVEGIEGVEGCSHSQSRLAVVGRSAVNAVHYEIMPPVTLGDARTAASVVEVLFKQITLPLFLFLSLPPSRC